MNGNMANQDLPDLAQIANDYGRMVSAVCIRMIQNPTIAEEAAQETWLEITRSLKNFRGRSKISTWIYTITRRVVFRYSQKEKQYSTKYLSSFFRADEPSPGFPDESKEYSQNIKDQCDKCLTGIIQCLDNDSRLAYIMRDIVNLSYNEISEVLARSEQTVRKDISRARNKLRRFLHKECFLFNPEGNCKCRMKGPVKEINLELEFENLRQTANKMRFFKETERILLRKDFWEKHLG